MLAAGIFPLNKIVRLHSLRTLIGLRTMFYWSIKHTRAICFIVLHTLTLQYIVYNKAYKEAKPGIILS